MTVVENPQNHGRRKIFAMLAMLLGFILGPANSNTIDVYSFSDPGQQRRFDALIDELRCPTCQNQSIADSNAPLSEDLRQRIYELLQSGYDDAAIRAYLVERYGDFISYRPPLEPATWLLWFGPLVIFLGAVTVLMVWIRQRQVQAPPNLSDQEQQRLQQLIGHQRES